MEEETRLTRLRHVRRAARCLRYKSLPQLIDHTITISSLGEISHAVQAWLDSLVPNCKGIEANQALGPLAKYGILDLEFRAPRELLPSRRAGVSTLKELAFFDGKDEWAKLNGGEEDIFFVEDLADSMTDNAILKLFMKDAVTPITEIRQRWELMRDPSEMQFPKQMRVLDACVSNSSCIWLLKHFYL